uniref:Uncharacterized protein n=1 Tax=Xiphophorus couchianus TaxID=32473 RepID=A0A3B5MS86_9TELE
MIYLSKQGLNCFLLIAFNYIFDKLRERLLKAITYAKGFGML